MPETNLMDQVERRAMAMPTVGSIPDRPSCARRPTGCRPGDEVIRRWSRPMPFSLPDSRKLQIERLKVKAAELEGQIARAINGERPRLQLLREQCLFYLGRFEEMD